MNIWIILECVFYRVHGSCANRYWSYDNYRKCLKKKLKELGVRGKIKPVEATVFLKNTKK